MGCRLGLRGHLGGGFRHGLTIGPEPGLGPRVEIRSAVLLYESQDPAPGVVARVLPLLEGAVEEAVRRCLVDVHLVRHLRLGQLLVEGVEHLHWRGGIGARDEHKERRLHLRNEGLAPWRPTIKADGSVETWLQGGLVPRARASKTEAGAEYGFDRTAVPGPQVRDRSRHIGCDVFLGRLV